MIEHERTELSYSTNEKSGDSQFRRKKPTTATYIRLFKRVTDW